MKGLLKRGRLNLESLTQIFVLVRDSTPYPCTRTLPHGCCSLHLNTLFFWKYYLLAFLCHVSLITPSLLPPLSLSLSYADNERS